jgi:Holliday junction DNA helicase RuvB
MDSFELLKEGIYKRYEMEKEFYKGRKESPTEIIIRSPDLEIDSTNAEHKKLSKLLSLSEYIGQEKNKRTIHKSIKIIQTIKPINIFLHGYPGCLAHDTYIKYHIYHNGKRSSNRGGTIKQLYHRFNNLPQKGKGNCLRPKYKNTEFYISSFKEKTKEIFLNKITNVIYSGKKRVYLLKTASGKKIKATSDHKFFINNTYKKLENLNVGDKIFIHPNKIYGNGKTKKKYRKEVYVKHHPSWKKRIINGCTYYRSYIHRAVYEAFLNNLSYNEYINLLNSKNLTKINKLKTIPINMDVHHKDENVNNNNINNLELLTKKEHYKKHKDIIDSKIKYYLEKDKIISIKYVGIEDTYDISVENPYRNLIANNIAVHNCGKSTLAEIIANELNAKYIYSIPEQLKDIEKVKEILNTIQLEKNLVVWMIDEIHNADKKLINILLPVLQDYKLGDVPIKQFVFIGATTDYNKLFQKSEALISRFQTKIKLDKYSLDELIQIQKLHQKKMQIDINIPEKDYEKIAQNSKGIPREALNLLLKRFVSENTEEVLEEHNIIKNGITETDVCILKALKNSSKPMGSGFLSQKVDLLKEDYEKVYEPYLVGQHYIERTRTGRAITNEGKQFLESIKTGEK